jgi:hypothetical protein
MSLRIRRGTDAQRQSVQLDLGELAYTTDTQKLFVGDGTVLGGHNILATSAGTGLIFDSITQTLKLSASVGIASVSADTAPHLGGDLILNSHNITGTGNINISGTVGLNTSVTIYQNSNNNYGGVISVKKSRGTSVAPTAVQSGDTLLLMGGQGYTGSTYTTGATIKITASGTVNTGVLQSSTQFTATTNLGTSVTAMTVNANNVNFSVPPIVPSYAGVSSYPSSASTGMIIYDTAVNHFFGYNGVAWRQLDN